MSLMRINGVTHSYPTSPRPVLRNIDLSIEPGEIVALVGESGCGKTTLGRLIAGLHEPSTGSIEFEGRDISKLRGGDKRDWRRRVQMVHQDPYGSLNPGLTLSSTLAPGLLKHKMANSKNVDEVMLDLMTQVGLDATPQFINRYPHQLSGGQRQRASIARAIGLKPDLIVADEVTSMLDVSMRVAILDLLLSFTKERGIGYVFISHDFGVVRYFAQGGRIAVMFFGVIVEEGPTDEVIKSPKHPYTHMLLEAIPIPNPVLAREREGLADKRLIGEPAHKGCVFANRCPMAQDACRTAQPPLQPVGGEGSRHRSACLFPEQVPPLSHVEREQDVAAELGSEGDRPRRSSDAAAGAVGATSDQDA